MGLLVPYDPESIERQRQYRDDSIFFLCTGEQAPFSSHEEILRMPVATRNYFVRKLADTYERQRQEMEKNSSNRKR
jgi:hypothetical protein